MAVCSKTCLLSAVFIISMIYMHNMSQKSSVVQNYQKQLPKELNELYSKIKDERLTIYYKGYILGFVLSLIVIFLGKRNKLTISSIVCTVIVVSFITNYFYYMLSPKTTYMLEHIKDEKQTKAWLEMYRAMQVFYHSGLVLGIIAVAIFAYAFRCF